MKIKKSTLESLILLASFFLSFLNSATLLLFFLVVLLLLRQKQVGMLKIISLLTLRTIISPAIAVEMGIFQSLKMVIIVACSFYLLTLYFKLDENSKDRLKWVMFTVVLFTVYNSINAFFVSSLPVVATFKVLSYSIVFLGVLTGVAYTINKFDIFEWMLKWFKLIMFTSLLTIPLPLAYIVNGRGFQGIVNHPNMFGVLAVLFIALLLGKNMSKIDYLYLIAAFLMIILSDSRTALISALVVIGLYILVNNIPKLTYLKISITSFIGAGLALMYKPILGFFEEFLAKGQDLENILYSREEQIDTVLFHFQQSPIFGNGFGVPVLPFRSYEFSMEYTIEPGNLILAVLSYGGVIGFLIFAVYMLQILLANKINLFKKPYLCIAPIMVSMGEMVFFSSNNIGPFCYFLFAMYIFYDKTKINETKNIDLGKTA